MIEAAIFDMDGLLVDSEPIWHDVEIEVFGRHGVALNVERCLETKGMYLGDAIEHWYARYPWSGATRDEVAAEITQAMAERLEAAVELKPGAIEALEFCRARGAVTALASSSPRRLIDAVVRRFGLAEGFGVVHSGEDEVLGKPDPGIFLTTARLLGIDPEHCVVFEDSAAGVRAGKRAGMVCVAVPEADATLVEVLERADVVLGSLVELDEAVWARLSAVSGS